MDEIEYVTGSANTKWGAQRAKDGHPAPFKLEYVEVGNEDRGATYDPRFTQFYDAIKAKYPTLKVIATTRVQSRKPDVLDEHFYRNSMQMQSDANHYDNYDRNGPKIFVGEWATREGAPTPNMNAALGDAAWMTGMERNSDHVIMSCYAPLFVNVKPRRHAMAHRFDRLRHTHQLWFAGLLRAKDVQPEPRRHGAGHRLGKHSHPRMAAAGGTGRRRAARAATSADTVFQRHAATARTEQSI